MLTNLLLEHQAGGTPYYIKRPSALRIVSILLVGMLALGGCNRPDEGPPPQSTPEVAAIIVETQSVTLTTELPGRTSAYLVSEIRPQVNGLILKRLFTEGADIVAGQSLYQIDPAPYQAALDNAQANLATTKEGADRARAQLDASIANIAHMQATLELAQTNSKRYQELFSEGAITAVQRDEVVTEVKVADASLRAAEAQVESDRQAIAAADAAIKQAEAAVETARINLGYTMITSPINGRIGRSSVTEGAIVTAYQPTALATVQQLDPIYVDVPQSTIELSRLKGKLASGQLKDNGAKKVKIILEDGSEYPQEGLLQFRDVTVDPTTGSVILRIVVPNPDGTLLPGMFVKAQALEGINEKAILVPQQAIGHDHKGNPIAYVVDANKIIEQREVALDRAIKDHWLIASGLAPGDHVVCEGIQNIRPGVSVVEVPFNPEASDKPADNSQSAQSKSANSK